MSIRKILVPTDFSPSSIAALEIAGELAARLDAALTLINVYEVPELITSSIASAVGTTAAVLQQLESDFAAVSAKRLEELLAAHPVAPGVRVERSLARGTPWVQIIRLAEEAGFDLIVMGTRGRTELAQMVLGSVAAKVIRKAPCPVMTVRAGAHPKDATI
jgi:universal stress protein A